MKNKAVYITGGASGIGLATAFRFAKEGCHIAIADINPLHVDERKKLKDLNVEVIELKVNVANEQEVKASIQETVSVMGRLDYAFNNAGIRNVTEITGLSLESWQQIIDVNLTGVFLGLKYQIPEIIKTKGAIVNTASIWGLTGAEGRSAYVASKAGVIGLTKTAASEYGKDGVRINAISPGLTMTEAAKKTLSEGIGIGHVLSRTSLGVPGTPDNIAEAVFWLCSDQAFFVNGVNLPVDGGWSAH